MRHVLGEVSLTENAPRIVVAQSSALMSQCAPLFTARQWLKRWRGAEQPLKRLLSDAGLEEEPALAATVGALLGEGSGVGESGGGGVQLSDLVTDMARLLLGLSRGRRGLALAVEGDTLPKTRCVKSGTAPSPALLCFLNKRARGPRKCSAEATLVGARLNRQAEMHSQQCRSVPCVAPSRSLNLAECAPDSEHIDASTMHVLDKVVATLRDEGAQGSKLFVILAVRSCEGIVDETMRGWVQDVGLTWATHMEVGPLSLEAARKLAVVSTPGGPSHDAVVKPSPCLYISTYAARF